MVALIILGILALIIFAICLIPVGADIDFTDERLTVSATVCGSLLQLFPRPPKPEGAEKKPKKPKKEKKPKEQAEPQPDAPKKKRKLPLDMNRDELLELIKAVFKGLGKFRKFKVDRFLLHVVVAGHDPYNTAMEYGYLNAFLSSLAPVCSANMTVKKSDVYTAVDFTEEWTRIDFGAAFSIRIGQIFGVINTILFGAVKVLIRNRIRVRKKRAQEKKEAQLNTNDTEPQILITDNTQHTINTEQTAQIQEDERNTDNGQN